MEERTYGGLSLDRLAACNWTSPSINHDLISHLRELLAENAALKADAEHWKANHDNQVQRARILIERTDLPLERVHAYERYAAIEADAARYVWLRDADMFDNPSVDVSKAFHRYTGSALDAAIDEAMTK